MELNYWSLIFLNGKEYTIQSEIDDINHLLNQLGERGVFFKDKGCIALQKTQESEPVFIMAKNLFSVQRLLPKSLSTQTKIWKLV